jgi:hypothetical protein
MADGFIGNAAAVCPDLTGVVLGVRGFGRVGHFLASPFQGDVWRRPTSRAACEPDRRATATALVATGAKPGAALTAAQRIVERQQARSDHDAPGDTCPCGLYAYHGLDHLARHQRTHPVVAAVHAWGQIMVHPRGFRAQHMRIVALALPADLDDGIDGTRLAEAARRAAAWWRIPLLGLDGLTASYREFGDPIPDELIPEEKEK